MKKDLLYKLLFLSCLIVGYSMVYKTEATTVRTNPSYEVSASREHEFVQAMASNIVIG
ncbi:hypothetical protein DEAC_c43530 [Desulfosporosinus acididurans]|uniref:Uncharacterized protein n=1 Tax=Desulfosporosinus acididurans TaxID=476652 RepID=A0A0J1FLB0_9FIRM|nr:hypothetical protein [Desulfosporosinus acididurans]KLU63718.1 hypothetical protein DEAC_c43530 [Desulfosporosinus acididurans]